MPFNPLKPFDGDGYADFVAPRRRAAAHLPLLDASITRSRKSCEYGFGIPAGLRPANRWNQNLPDSGIPIPIQVKNRTL
jgi:hypothetical protein